MSLTPLSCPPVKITYAVGISTLGLGLLVMATLEGWCCRYIQCSSPRHATILTASMILAAIGIVLLVSALGLWSTSCYQTHLPRSASYVTTVVFVAMVGVGLCFGSILRWFYAREQQDFEASASILERF